MSEPTKSPLVDQVESIVLATFDVSPAKARSSAEWLVDEAERWGGGGGAFLDWNYQVKKWFGDDLKWRSEVEHRRYLVEMQTLTGAYETYRRKRNQSVPQPGPAGGSAQPASATKQPPPVPATAAPITPSPIRADAPKPPPLVDVVPVVEPPVLTDEERALGFELREILHLPDLAGWEQIVQVSLPVLDRPPRLDAKGRTPDGYRTSVVKILGEADVICRARQSGKRVYSHLRFGNGSCWGYATFGGGAAWHPVSDPYGSAREAVARASVTQENPGMSIFPEKFSSRPAGTG